MDVMTVRGPVSGADLGITLPHEHLLLDLYQVFQPHRDMKLYDKDLAAAELDLYAKAGGGTLVEVTTPDLGRDPKGLVELSDRTGVHIVMGTGRYREPFYEQDIWRMTTNQVADLFILEIREGVDGGIRPGIIGEIGVHGPFISPAEERVHRAVARAHLATGLAITLHANATPIGLPQLDLLSEEGVDLSRVVVGHCDTYADRSYHLAILEKGAYVEYDTIRGSWDFETKRQLKMVLDMVEQGYIDRLLLSQDLAVDKFYTAYGGNGYTFVVSKFAALLRDAGLSEAQLRQLLVDNPRRMLTGEVS